MLHAKAEGGHDESDPCHPCSPHHLRRQLWRSARRSPRPSPRQRACTARPTAMRARHAASLCVPHTPPHSPVMSTTVSSRGELTSTAARCCVTVSGDCKAPYRVSRCELRKRRGLSALGAENANPPPCNRGRGEAARASQLELPRGAPQHGADPRDGRRAGWIVLKLGRACL